MDEIDYSDCVGDWRAFLNKLILCFRGSGFSNGLHYGLSLSLAFFLFYFSQAHLSIDLLDLLHFSILLNQVPTHIIINNLNNIILHFIECLKLLLELYYFMDKRWVI